MTLEAKEPQPPVCAACGLPKAPDGHCPGCRQAAQRAIATINATAQETPYQTEIRRLDAIVDPSVRDLAGDVATEVYSLGILTGIERAEQAAAAGIPWRATPADDPDAEGLARLFHETYERLAPEHGYRTREASAKPWHEVPDANRRLMIDTAAHILGALKTTPPIDAKGSSSGTGRPLRALEPGRTDAMIMAARARVTAALDAFFTALDVDALVDNARLRSQLAELRDAAGMPPEHPTEALVAWYQTALIEQQRLRDERDEARALADEEAANARQRLDAAILAENNLAALRAGVRTIADACHELSERPIGHEVPDRLAHVAGPHRIAEALRALLPAEAPSAQAPGGSDGGC